MTPALRSKVEELWDRFWSGGIANPLTAIEQISYLLFMRRPDRLSAQTNAGQHTLRDHRTFGRRLAGQLSIQERFPQIALDPSTSPVAPRNSKTNSSTETGPCQPTRTWSMSVIGTP